jgi:hypothetical protein
VAFPMHVAARITPIHGVRRADSVGEHAR